MTKSIRRPRVARALLAVCLTATITLLAPLAGAVRAPDVGAANAPKAAHLVFAPELDVRPSVSPSQNLVGLTRADAGVARFMQANPGQWTVTWDSRGNRPNMIVGSGIPLLPGRGNQLTRASLGIAGNRAIDFATVGTLLQNFIDANADILKTDGLTLRLDAKSAQPFGAEQNHWFVNFDQYANGVPVQGAHLFFRIAAGNIVQFGSYLVAPVTIDTRPTVDAGAAFEQAFKALGFPTGTHVTDWLERGKLEIVPWMADGAAMRGQRFTGTPGTGYGHKLVWEFKFRVQGDRTTYRVLVDAHTGATLDARDVNQYATATVSGGVFPAGARNTVPEVVVPFPFAAVTNNGNKVTDFDGHYNYDGGTAATTLDGKYVSIVDDCGNAALADASTGDLQLGTNAGTDCARPANDSSTKAARNAFYYLTLANRKAATYYPSNAWLNGKVKAEVNENDVCNAFWDGSALNFFMSGSYGNMVCANTGELSGVFLHEFGHGIQQNVGGSPSDMGTGEATGDTFAFLQTRDGCIGDGFQTNASGNCTGVRDVSAYSAASGSSFVVKPSNITTAGGPDCDNGMACPYYTQGQPYQGPMGYEGHCESLIASTANWDLAQQLANALGTDAGWQKMDDLWYAILPDNTAAYQVESGGTCNTAATVNGCASNNWYNLYLAADDDDGNLANGTPNACRIWDAFNAHGIACGERPACTLDGFGAEMTPTTAAVCAPAAATYTISTRAYGQPPFATPIQLAITGLPAGVSAGFSANPVASGATSVLTLDTSHAAASHVAFTVTATASGADSRVMSGVLAVSAGIPAAPALTAPANGASAVDPTVTLRWQAIAGASAYTVEVATDSAFSNIVVSRNDVTGPAMTLSLNPETQYYWRVTAASGCGLGATSTASFTTGELPFPAPYCAIDFPSTVEPISRVVFAGIDHTSSAKLDDTPALEDFTAISGNVVPSSNQTITVEGNTNGGWGNTVFAFADWNQDGDFDDVGETYKVGKLADSTGSDGKQVTATIAVPANARAGATRLRVVKNYGSADFAACDGGSFGQGEDYSLVVATGPTIAVTPASLALGAAAGATASGDISIANTGHGNLEWTLAEDPARLHATSSYLTGGIHLGTAAPVAGRLQQAPAGASAAQGQPLTLLPEQISQMADNTPGNAGVACSDSPTKQTFDNSWWRRFYFGEYAKIGPTAGVTQVVISTGGSTLAAALPVTINLYTIPHGTPLDTIDTSLLTLIGTADTTVQAALQSVTVPITGQVTDTAAMDLVVEVHTDGNAAGDGDYYPGANATAETHPTFISSATCGIAEPTKAAEVGNGFPDFHMTMAVTAETTPPACSIVSDVPWLSAGTTAGTVSGGASVPVTLTADATGLADGTYDANVCVISNDVHNPVLTVPVRFVVGDNVPSDVIFADGFDGSQP